MYDDSRRGVLAKGLSLIGTAAFLQGGHTVNAWAGDGMDATAQAFNTKPLDSLDESFLRRAIGVAERGNRPENGSNHPYGAVIRFEDGSTLEAWNTVTKNGDPTRHAEMTLFTEIFSQGMRWPQDKDKLAKATLYASAEPCFMCSGAIFWSGVGRVVFGVSAAQINQIYKEYFPDTADSQLKASAMGALAGVGVEINGPYLVEESAGLMHRVLGGRVGQDNPFKKQD